MDGNGRWAKHRGLPRSEGHRAGTLAAKAIVTSSRRLGIEHLTLYTFSRENWRRPQEEVGFLFDLLVAFLRQELKSLKDQDIRLKVLGDVDGLPFAVRQVLKHVMSQTAQGSAMTLNLALNYSGRDEILHACRRLLSEAVPPEALTEELFQDRLYTSGQPDPDLVIRTSGELRLSNYLLFQSAYSELYFTDVLWPDFTEAELLAAIEDYRRRERRFGRSEPQPGSADNT